MYQFVLAFIVSVFVTFIATQWLIVNMKEAKITGIDMNKPSKPEIPEMGGIAVVVGTTVGVYVLLAVYDIFEIGNPITHFIMASLMTLMGIGMIGMLDDLVNMKQSIKAVLPFLISAPLGHYVNSVVVFPIIGGIDLGYGIYFIVPLAITCAANSMNMLEGFNGLGTGLGIIITASMIIMAILNDVTKGLYFFVPLLGSLVAFLYFNKYPAKIFPGDTMTLFLGGTIACGALISDLKFEGLLLLSPMIIEFFLKLRGNFKGECYASALENDRLIHKGKIESLTHLVMVKFSVNENRLVQIFWGFEGVLAIMVIVLSWVHVL